MAGHDGSTPRGRSVRELWVQAGCCNRSRVFAASFLVETCCCRQVGLKHFWDTLLDADLECDALGQRYVAGCHCDAPPFVYMPDYPGRGTAV
jgi:deoxyribodipyrimidine photolyase